MKIPDLRETDIAELEGQMDQMNAGLEEMKSFIIPGGHPAVSIAHICRCVCRRAERICVDMQVQDLFIDPLVIQYLNRLSDYFFVLARYISKQLNVGEITWKPRTGPEKKKGTASSKK